MNKIILLASLFAIYIIGYYGMTGIAFAQYVGGTTSEPLSLEQTLELARIRVEIANEFPGTGSGTPYLDATGIIGSTAIAAAVFGGIAGALFLKGRSGKYAAQGRG